MADYELRCTVCGAVTEVQSNNLEQLHAAKTERVYICPGCQAKIQYESGQKYK